MPGVTVTDSIFNPADAATCVSSGYDLNSDSCKARNNGTARPPANGTYTSFVQDFGITATFRL